MLGAATARLTRPALAAAVARWKGEWHAEEQLRLLRDHDELSRARSDLEHTRRTSIEELGAQAEAAAHELAEQRDLATRDLSAAERGAAAAHGLELEARLEAEKEKRIAHLSQLAARRVCNREIAMGFITWNGQWAEAARQKRLLAAAGARLARPQLAAAVALWVGEWRKAELDEWREVAFKARSGHEATLADLRGEMRASLAAARLEAAARLAEAAEALEEERSRSRSELKAARREFEGISSGQSEDARTAAEEHEKALETKMAAEREKRVEHLSQLAARRVMNREIASGFSAWQEQWEEAARQKRMLAAAGARLLKPKLVACFVAWTASWQSDQKLTAFGGHAQLLAEKVSPNPNPYPNPTPDP